MTEHQTKMPKRRFKGYTGEWEEVKLGDVASMKARIGWQGLTKGEFLDKGDYYLITGTDFQNGSIKFEDCHYIGEDRYKQDVNIQIRNTDVLITKDGTIGKVAYVKGLDKPATLNAGVFVLRGKNKNINQLFLYHYLAAPFLLDYANMQATGGTIKHLNQNVLVDFPMYIPSFEEQQKIGEFFSELDERIELQKSKIEKMTALKKAYLSEMFPAEGETTPKRRFKGFTGEWKREYLKDLGIFFKGSGISKTNLSDEGYSCILYGELYTKYNEVIKSVQSKTNIELNNPVIGKVNDILIPSSGETAIDIATASCLQVDGVLLGGDLNIFRPHNVNGIFISYQLGASKKMEIAKMAQGSSVIHVYNEQLKDLVVDIPTLEEQQKIGEFFSELNEMIELHKEKLEKLQNLKQAYLNELLI